MSKSSAVTTRELESLVTAANALYAKRCRLDRVRREAWRAWRNEMVARLHSVMKPAARPYAGKVLVDIVSSLLAELGTAWRLVDRLATSCSQLERKLLQAQEQCIHLRQKQEQAAFQVETLTRELSQARAELARCAVPKTVVVPARTIEIRSPLQRETLRLMADEGLGRVWRIAARLVASGACIAENSARNAIQKLSDKGLIDDYQQHGRCVGWALKPGGQRRLVTLTEAGRLWCRGAFGREPIESEIAVTARRHKSVAHGVAVLEARDLLRGYGVEVDDDPATLLVSTERWGTRVEPDLIMMLGDVPWPVEVQREVSSRTLGKWHKTLELMGRLALILFSEEAAKKQIRILHETLSPLRASTVLVTSLESLERGTWAWQEIVVL